MNDRIGLALVTATLLTVAACAAEPARPAWTATPERPPTAAVSARVVTVYKSPTCSCCHEWEAYMRAHGWEVRSRPTEDLGGVKARHRIPDEMASCHTALIDGYVVEGHMPIEAIERMLRERPAIDGIALPAMPPGSPGMPGVADGAFEVYALVDGATTSYGSF